MREPTLGMIAHVDFATVEFANHIANHIYDAFGLLPDSPIRHVLNTALVTRRTTADSWTSMLASYLGKVD